jgi:predicted transcriptional regulator of viral defense system
MAKKPSTTEKVLALVRKNGVLRVRDLQERGIHPEYLRRLCTQGVLQRTGRGLYVLAEGDYSENLSLMEAARRVPKGVVSHVSALRFHEVGTQLPRAVWMTIDRRAHRPRVDYPPMRFLLASGKALRAGVEHHQIDGVDVKVYNVAKTIVDCFKYRNKIGLDVAIEALREGLRGRKCSVDEITQYARICRVAAVMQPYLEATV